MRLMRLMRVGFLFIIVLVIISWNEFLFVFYDGSVFIVVYGVWCVFVSLCIYDFEYFYVWLSYIFDWVYISYWFFFSEYFGKFFFYLCRLFNFRIILFFLVLFFIFSLSFLCCMFFLLFLNVFVLSFVFCILLIFFIVVNLFCVFN